VTQAASTTSTGDYATWRLGVAAELQRQHGIAFDSTWPLLAAMNSLSRRGSKLLARIVSMIKLTPTTDWLPASWKRRWNERLANVRVLEEQLSQHDTEPALVLRPEDRERLLALGRDLPRAWDSVGASVETRKKILRLLIHEIVVDVVADKIELVIHWQGGDHTRLA
jgi:hypothetical protein